MVTVEVELAEDDKEPEQHLDEGEHIERVVVPLSELYDKLQGGCRFSIFSDCVLIGCSIFEREWQNRGR